jgi:serine phosphatase RsbU (regulator of sigma subunit)
LSTSPPAPSARPRALHVATVVVVLVGLLITGVLSFGAQSLHNTNESRLLRQRVREAAAVVSAAVPNVQSPLASAAVLAEATAGSPTAFQKLMAPLAASGRPFMAASLWSLADGNAQLIASVGGKLRLASEPPATIHQELASSLGKGSVAILNFLASSDRRLGYAYSVAGANANFVVYVEATFPDGRRATVDKNSAFADLDYALYLGKAANPTDILASSTGGAILGGSKASDAVPFGSSSLFIVMKAKKELDGNLLANLPWGLAAAGLVLTLAGALLVERLLRRRDHAEALALENDELYKEQRSVAQTLQHSLLPDSLPEIAGLELATRYVAGVEGIDIGGDWYDVMTIDPSHVLFVVGDVSGRGLRAATTMAELRYAVRAYAAQGDAPEVILTKVSQLIDVGRDGHFATAICGSIDVAGHTVSLANAGHPEPLLIAGGDAGFAGTEIGAPLGVVNPAPYSSVSLAIPVNGTLLFYTDGLVERRGESLDVGRERLRRASLDTNGSMEDLLTRVLDETIPSGSADDTAILGFRWQN